MITILKDFSFLNTFKNMIYLCETKLNFFSYYSSIQCHMIIQKSL